MTWLLGILALIASWLPVPAILDVEYRFYERGPQVVALQEELGGGQVDGVYGPKTRAAHMGWFGGASVAHHRWYGGGRMGVPGKVQSLVNEYFEPGDRAWAMRVAFCESSTQPQDDRNFAVSPALAVGAFQHLAKYWPERSQAAGFAGYSAYDMRANVATAAHLFYTSGLHHWNASRSCWSRL